MCSSFTSQCTGCTVVRADLCTCGARLFVQPLLIQNPSSLLSLSSTGLSPFLPFLCVCVVSSPGPVVPLCIDFVGSHATRFKVYFYHEAYCMYYTLLSTSVPTVATARGMMFLGCWFHSFEHNSSGTPSENFFQFSTNIHFKSQIIIINLDTHAHNQLFDWFTEACRKGCFCIIQCTFDFFKRVLPRLLAACLGRHCIYLQTSCCLLLLSLACFFRHDENIRVIQSSSLILLLTAVMQKHVTGDSVKLLVLVAVS